MKIRTNAGCTGEMMGNIMSILKNPEKWVMSKLLSVLNNKKFQQDIFWVIKTRFLENEEFRKKIFGMIEEELNKPDMAKELRKMVEILGIVETVKKDIITPQSDHVEIINLLDTINENTDEMIERINQIEDDLDSSNIRMGDIQKVQRELTDEILWEDGGK